MKKIFEGKIYDIVPKSDGIIFSYQKAVIDEGEVVCFKMISIENSLMTDIGKIYIGTKNSAVTIMPRSNRVKISS